MANDTSGTPGGLQTKTTEFKVFLGFGKSVTVQSMPPPDPPAPKAAGG